MLAAQVMAPHEQVPSDPATSQLMPVSLHAVAQHSLIAPFTGLVQWPWAHSKSSAHGRPAAFLVTQALVVTLQ